MNFWANRGIFYKRPLKETKQLQRITEAEVFWSWVCSPSTQPPLVLPGVSHRAFPSPHPYLEIQMPHPSSWNLFWSFLVSNSLALASFFSYGLHLTLYICRYLHICITLKKTVSFLEGRSLFNTFVSSLLYLKPVEIKKCIKNLSLNVVNTTTGSDFIGLLRRSNKTQDVTVPKKEKGVYLCVQTKLCSHNHSKHHSGNLPTQDASKSGAGTGYAKQRLVIWLNTKR